jgi:hypothetical protein
MKINDLRKRAKALGINSARKGKAELIRAVQKAEGNFDCFGTAREFCDQLACCFREDCLKPRE